MFPNIHPLDPQMTLQSHDLETQTPLRCTTAHEAQSTQDHHFFRPIAVWKSWIRRFLQVWQMGSVRRMVVLQIMYGYGIAEREGMFDVP